MSTEVTVPAMGESITEAVILRWLKSDGDQVAADEPLCELETDKATFDLPSPASGTLTGTLEVGATVRVGQVVAKIEAARVGSAASPLPKPAATESAKPAAPPAQETPPRAPRPEEAKPQPLGKPEPPAANEAAVEKPSVTKAETAKPAPPLVASPPKVSAPVAAPAPAKASVATPEARPQPDRAAANRANSNGQRREPMSKIRRRIAERLVRAQHTAAMLTTFNEVDMTNVLDVREKHKEEFEKAHGVSLGLMSFFARATVLAMKHFPIINAAIDGDDIVYNDHVNLGVAVNTERGLVVPILRNAEDLSFSRIEKEIKRVAIAARDGKLAIEELSGGTFTITNGGVFGSLLSTPILNPPQSAILGMHTIQRRPVCVGEKIRARRMMYVALSYDHRLVDGRDAVQFLVKLKKLLEEPLSMLLEG